MSIDLLRRVKGTLNKRFVQNKMYFKQWLAGSMVINTMGFSALLAASAIQVEAMPAKSVKQDKVWVSEVRMDTTKPMPVVLPQKDVTIKVEPLPQPKPVVRERSVVARERVPAATPAPSKPVQPAMNPRELAQKAAARYNVPWQIVEAVWQVETGKSWDTGKCSYAGACGPMQFMPGTWRRYGVDADGDGDKQITSAMDAVYAGAHYLAVSGADRGQMVKALMSYNHSMSYVNKVLKIAREIGYSG